MLSVPVLDDWAQSSNVLGSRAATAADHRDTRLKQLGQACRHFSRRQRIHPRIAGTRGRAGIRSSKERQIGRFTVALDNLDNFIHADVAPAVDAERLDAMLASSFGKPF